MVLFWIDLYKRLSEVVTLYLILLIYSAISSSGSLTNLFFFSLLNNSNFRLSVRDSFDNLDTELTKNLSLFSPLVTLVGYDSYVT